MKREIGKRTIRGAITVLAFLIVELVIGSLAGIGAEKEILTMKSSAGLLMLLSVGTALLLSIWYLKAVVTQKLIHAALLGVVFLLAHLGAGKILLPAENPAWQWSTFLPIGAAVAAAFLSSGKKKRRR